jgi:hypothetical protein
VDPNEHGTAESAKETKSAPRRASLAARVRVAAEQLPSFTRAEFLTAVFGPEPSHIERQWFSAAWNQMVMKGHVIEAKNGRFNLAPDIDPAVDSIRRILKERAGGAISSQGMAEELGFAPTGPQMRHALDLLKAEGYGVRRQGHGGKKTYSVGSDLGAKSEPEVGTSKDPID